jgi:drug/metabolite transporter (DMT)-like permease
MRSRNLVMLVGLALIWGASFMFIRVADRQLAPATLIMGRLGLAALTLALVVPMGSAPGRRSPSCGRTRAGSSSSRS